MIHFVAKWFVYMHKGEENGIVNETIVFSDRLFQVPREILKLGKSNGVVHCSG